MGSRTRTKVVLALVASMQMFMFATLLSRMPEVPSQGSHLGRYHGKVDAHVQVSRADASDPTVEGFAKPRPAGGLHVLPGAGREVQDLRRHIEEVDVSDPQWAEATMKARNGNKLLGELVQMPTFEQLARDITVVMSAKDEPTVTISGVVEEMMRLVYGKRGVKVLLYEPMPMVVEPLRRRLRELEQQWGGLLEVHEAPPYWSQNEVRQHVLNKITTKYTLFMEDTAFCGKSDCLEQMWMAAEYSEHEHTLFASSEDYYPYKAWQPTLHEACEETNLHSQFNPFLVEHEFEGSKEYTYGLGFEYLVSGWPHEKVKGRLDKSLDRKSNGQRFLEDHAFLCDTAFFREHREELFLGEMTSRFEFLHFPLVMYEHQARVRPVPDVSALYHFWCPSQPEAMHWIFVKRHIHSSWEECDAAPLYWGFFVGSSCTNWVYTHIGEKLHDAHWTYEDPSTLTPSYYPPDPLRGMHHAQLLLSAWLYSGSSSFRLVLDGVPTTQHWVEYRQFMTNVAEYYMHNSDYATLVEVEVGSKHYARKALKYAESYLHPEREFDPDIHPRRHLERIKLFLALYEPNPAQPPVHRADEEMQAVRQGTLVGVCRADRRTRLGERGAVSVLDTRGGACAGMLTMYYWLDGKNDTESRAILEGLAGMDGAGIFNAEQGYRIRIPAHPTDDSVTVREWQYQQLDVSQFEGGTVKRPGKSFLVRTEQEFASVL
eukprot:TRINITY_DN8879_c0_g1_i1.p1 TRINITY_DN8879_c0_g1~~TRINITY_DN8879_c0_g1_i1.p1  ORF type:complete len:712 (+),score=89.13 TRINITY_DN8879_c0_g1_i1:422-2557(+)